MRRRRERNLCPYSGKVCYLSRADAEWALAAIVKDGRVRRTDANRLAVYECLHGCHRWHLGRIGQRD